MLSRSPATLCLSVTRPAQLKYQSHFLHSGPANYQELCCSRYLAAVVEVVLYYYQS